MMKSLYDKNQIKKIRSIYKKNIECPEGYQRAHIFGFRESKYIELNVENYDFNIFVKILTCNLNCILLTENEHIKFDMNKKKVIFNNVIQEKLYELSTLVRQTKYRKNDKLLCEKIYTSLENIVKTTADL